MRTLYLWSSALWAALSGAQYVKRLNFNSSAPVSSSSSSSSTALSSRQSLSSTSTPITLGISDATLPGSTPSLSSSGPTSTKLSTLTITTPINTSTAAHNSSTLVSTANVTSLVTSNATAPAPTHCTGCVLEAYYPVIFSFNEEDHATQWSSVVVTQTVLVLTITYMQGTAIDTVITTQQTLNQTKTIVIGTANQTITHTAPSFTQPVGSDTILTFASGPTYILYTSLFGGLEQAVETDTALFTTSAEPTCDPDVNQLYLPGIEPTRTEDWSAFIQTITGSALSLDDPTTPFPLPPALLQRLKLDPDIRSVFNGSDIATCTQYPSNSVPVTFFPPPLTTSPFTTSPQGISFSPHPTPATSTYLSTTYQSTSTHVTRQGCLRCDTTAIVIGPPDASTPVKPDPSQVKPNPSPDPSQVKPNDNPPVTQKPDKQPQTGHPGQTITIGDSVITIHPAQPTQSDQQNIAIVIGSQTLTAGQTTTINGVVIVVPTGVGGSSIVVGGSTIAVNPVPTGPPVLTVGDNTITANSQGQFVVGTQTLTPGGPAITVDGSTLSLGPSGTIAVINGVTQTLGHVPFITGPPVLTVGDHPVTATIVGGTTQFVLGPGQTLRPGGVLTIDGTTFSMPWDSTGSTIVVNGVTSTLNAPGLPIITLGNRPITATVQGGTTAFVLGPGQTLFPGGVLTVSGTTYSMPISASGSVVVINGITTTLGQVITAAPLLTIDGKTYTATTRDGTTEYVVGPGTTLRPGSTIVVDGTTYSLDTKGTALIINGKTSSIRQTPASNSAKTTATATATTTTSSSISTRTSASESSSESSGQSSTSERAPANFIASGLGISKTAGAAMGRTIGLDMWVESLVIGVAGWLMVLL